MLGPAAFKTRHGQAAAGNLTRRVGRARKGQVGGHHQGQGPMRGGGRGSY
jgi:hypothetical protein